MPDWFFPELDDTETAAVAGLTDWFSETSPTRQHQTAQQQAAYKQAHLQAASTSSVAAQGYRLAPVPNGTPGVSAAVPALSPMCQVPGNHATTQVTQASKGDHAVAVAQTNSKAKTKGDARTCGESDSVKLNCTETCDGTNPVVSTSGTASAGTHRKASEVRPI